MKRNKIICPSCGQEISKANFSKHQRRHQEHPETFEIPKYKINHEGLDCQFCGKTCKNNNSLRNHERLCKENPDRQDDTYLKNNLEKCHKKGHAAWNKGLTKEVDPRIKKSSEARKLYIKEHGSLGSCGLTGANNVSSRPEVREKISLAMVQRYAYPRGWAKRGWYAGIWCDSSWELAYVLYAQDHNIKFIRNREYFEYVWEGCKHHYTPDFYLPDIDTYLEIKGNYDQKAKAKKDQFERKLIIYQRAEMLPILQYVENTYGKNFTDLYDAEVPKG